MRLDLHLHTTCSDGTVPPEELAAQARRAALGAIAITDHDTVAGIARARSAGVSLGLQVIAGIELTCTLDGSELHLLGYGIAPDHPALAAIIRRLGAMRRERLGQIVERLRSLGVAITTDDVEAGADNRAVGRPHVARALVRLGVTRDVQEAFDRFLGSRAPAYVPGCGPDVAEAIAAVHEAGGVCAWAHPGSEDAARFAGLAARGLDAAEVLRPNLTGAVSRALERAARAAGLVISGGSDWHGGPPPLGTWFVTERQVGALLDRLGVARERRGAFA